MWEYLTLTVSDTGFNFQGGHVPVLHTPASDPDEYKELWQVLNLCGRLEWELVSVIPSSETNFEQYIFKRAMYKKEKS